MAKGKKSVFFCQNCGHEENKWLGQCPMCKEWNTFVEEAVSVSKRSTVKLTKDAEIVAEGIVCETSGTYDVYAKFKYEQDEVYIGPAQ
jgi:predicted ATP-dependent serine protease